MLNFDSRGGKQGAQVAAALSASVLVDLAPGDVLYIPPLTPHHVECLGDSDDGGGGSDDNSGGYCVGFNVFSTGAFSTIIGDIQGVLARSPLAWLQALTPPELLSPPPRSATAGDGDYNNVERLRQRRQAFTFSLLQYELRELTDRLGLSLSVITRGLLQRAWGPLKAEGAPEATHWVVPSPNDVDAQFIDVVTQAQFVPRLCSGSGSGWLHPQLEVVFGDERGVLKALSRTASYEVELAQKLEQLESYFRQLHSADDSSSINEEEGRQTAVEAAGAAAMVAILQEVVEGQVIAAVGLEAAYAFAAACLLIE